MSKKDKTPQKEKPEIFAVQKEKNKTNTSRRNFMGLGLGIGAGAILNVAGSKKAMAQNSQTDWKLSGDICDHVQAHDSGVRSVVFSPDGKTLASKGYNDIKLWDIPSGKLVKTIEGEYSRGFCGLAFNPDGTLLASVDYKAIHLISIPDGNLLKTIAEHSAWIYAFAFNPDGSMLVTGSGDKTIKFWTMPEGKLLTSIDDLEGSANSLCFSNDGTILASAVGTTISLWKIPDLLNRLSHLIPKQSRTDNKFLKTCGLSMAAISSLKVIQDQNNETQNTNVQIPENSNYRDKFEKKKLFKSLKSGVLISSGIAAAAILNSCENPKSSDDKKNDDENNFNIELIKSVKGHTGAINSLDFRSDGKMLASCSSDNTIKLWNVPEFDLIKILEGNKERVIKKITFNPDGTLLVSGSSYQYGISDIMIWRIPDGELLKSLILWHAEAESVVISPDGTLIAVAGDCLGITLEGKVELWQLPNGDPHWCLYDAAIVEKTDCRKVSQKEQISNNSICTCDLVCTCDTISVAPDTPLTGEITCTCDTISIGDVCTCDSVSSSCSSCGGCGYWYPN